MVDDVAVPGHVALEWAKNHRLQWKLGVWPLESRRDCSQGLPSTSRSQCLSPSFALVAVELPHGCNEGLHRSNDCIAAGSYHIEPSYEDTGRRGTPLNDRSFWEITEVFSGPESKKKS
jgi:hypothetical protein